MRIGRLLELLDTLGTAIAYRYAREKPGIGDVLMVNIYIIIINDRLIYAIKWKKDRKGINYTCQKYMNIFLWLRINWIN